MDATQTDARRVSKRLLIISEWISARRWVWANEVFIYWEWRT